MDSNSFQINGLAILATVLKVIYLIILERTVTKSITSPPRAWSVRMRYQSQLLAKVSEKDKHSTPTFYRALNDLINLAWNSKVARMQRKT